MPHPHPKASGEQEALELFLNVGVYRSVTEQTSRPTGQPAMYRSSVGRYLFHSHMEVEGASHLIVD